NINSDITVVGCSYHGRSRNIVNTVVSSVFRKTAKHRSDRVNQSNVLLVNGGVTTRVGGSPCALNNAGATAREVDVYNFDCYIYIRAVVDSSYFVGIGNTCTVNSDVGWWIHEYGSFCIIVLDGLHTVGKVAALVGSSVGTDDGAGALV